MLWNLVLPKTWGLLKTRALLPVGDLDSWSRRVIGSDGLGSHFYPGVIGLFGKHFLVCFD